MEESGETPRLALARMKSEILQALQDGANKRPGQIPDDQNFEGHDVDDLVYSACAELFSGGLIRVTQGDAKSDWVFGRIEATKLGLTVEPEEFHQLAEAQAELTSEYPGIETYLFESEQCYQQGLWNAMMVMLGCAMEYVLYELAAKFCDREKDEFDHPYDAIDRLRSALNELSGSKGDAISHASITSALSLLDLVRTTRNQAGHPEDIEIGPEKASSRRSLLISDYHALIELHRID